MRQLNKISVILNLIDSLKENGSWCGETHIQKAAYFLQELTDVPIDYDFILYKHGPFSFDLRDDLSSMQADNLIKVVLQPYPYGPSLVTTEPSKELREKFPITLKKYEKAVSFVAENLGDLGVAELERMATALYVSRQLRNQSPVDRAKKICELKPHIDIEKAQRAVETLDELIARCDAN